MNCQSGMFCHVDGAKDRTCKRSSCPLRMRSNRRSNRLVVKSGQRTKSSSRKDDRFLRRRNRRPALSPAASHWRTCPTSAGGWVSPPTASSTSPRSMHFHNTSYLSSPFPQRKPSGHRHPPPELLDTSLPIPHDCYGQASILGHQRAFANESGHSIVSHDGCPCSHRLRRSVLDHRDGRLIDSPGPCIRDGVVRRS